MKYVIPSYRRAERQDTLKLLLASGVKKEDIHLVLHTEEELAGYSKFNDLSGINTYITHAHGIVGQMQWIFDNIKQPFIRLDDDIECMQRLEGRKWITEPSINVILDTAFDVCRTNNAVMFGFCPYSNSFMVSNAPSILVDKYFYGGINGFADFKCVLPDWLVSMEDVYYQLAALQAGLHTLRLNHFRVKTKMVSAGGMEEERKEHGMINNDNNEVLKKVYASFDKEVIKRFGNRRLSSAENAIPYSYDHKKPKVPKDESSPES